MDSRIQLGPWSLDPASGELRQQDKKIILPRQQHQLLMTLVNAGHDSLVTREAIIATLWPDGRVVEFDQSLNASMRKLRRALGDNSDNPIFIETVTGKGYRLKVEPGHKKPSSTTKVKYLPVVILTMLVATWLLWPGVAKNKTVPVIAVMPVTTVSVDAEDPLALSLREELLTQFNRASVNELIILAPGSIDSRDASAKIPGSLYLLTSISQDPINKRIHLRLVDEQDTQLWSESFDWLKGGGTRSYQRIASQVAQSVSRTLNISIPQISGSTLTLSEESLKEYNQGLFLMTQGSPVDLLKAVEKFQSVLKSYSNYVPALAKVANLRTKLASSDPSRRFDHFSKAKDFAQRALSLDQHNAEAWVALAYYQFYHSWDFAQTRNSLDKAIAASPNHSDARSLDAAWYASQGVMHSSIEQARLAKRIDPQSMTVNADLCWYLNFAENFKQAERECTQILELQPSALWTRLGLVEAFRQQSKWHAAAGQLMIALGSSAKPAKDISESELRTLYQTWLDKMLPLYAQGNIDAYFIATLQASAGNEQQTLEWLEKAVQDRNGFLVFAQVDPRFIPFRDSADFARIVQTIFKDQ